MMLLPARAAIRAGVLPSLCSAIVHIRLIVAGSGFEPIQANPEVGLLAPGLLTLKPSPPVGAGTGIVRHSEGR